MCFQYVSVVSQQRSCQDLWERIQTQNDQWQTGFINITDRVQEWGEKQSNNRGLRKWWGWQQVGEQQKKWQDQADGDSKDQTRHDEADLMNADYEPV